MLVVVFHTLGIVSCGVSVLFWYLLIREQRLVTGKSRKPAQFQNSLIRPQKPSDVFASTLPLPPPIVQATGQANRNLLFR
jgi:hypothetical protein